MSLALSTQPRSAGAQAGAESFTAERARERLVDQLFGPVSALSPVDQGRFAATLDAGGGAGRVHVVRHGDTLSDIARANGTTVAAIAAANRLDNPDLILPGQRLVLPEGAAAVHVVRRGDTLSGIAARHGTSWQALARLNGLANPDLILPGQMLRLPGATGPVPTEPLRPAAPPPAGPSGGGAGGVSAAGLDALYRREAQAGVSERLHWPGGASGVTLGPGYDLRHRSAPEIVRDLTAIGVPQATADQIARGAGLSGTAARDFAAANRTLVMLSPGKERALLAQTVAPYAEAVRAAVRVPITRNQFDALVSFAYNIGVDSFRGSTALRRLNAGDTAGAAEAMGWWNKSGGVVMDGLVNRRAAEIRQFNTPGPAFDPGAGAVAPAPANQPAGVPRTAAEAVALIEARGDAAARADLAAGRRVVLALRTDTNVRENPAGRYDDTVLVVWRGADGQARMQAFAANTEPSGQYRFDGARASRAMGVDVNGDGRRDLGRLVEGSYRYTRQAGHYLGDVFFRPDSVTPVERDTNGDGWFDGRDPARIDRTGAGTSMLIHTGGTTNSWSAGCQTMAPDTYRAFVSALGGQDRFSYVLVNANARP